MNIAHLWSYFLSDISEGSEDGDRIELPAIEEYIYSSKMPSLQTIAMVSILKSVKDPCMKVADYDESFKLLLPKHILDLIYEFEDDWIMYVFENYVEPAIIYNYDGYN